MEIKDLVKKIEIEKAPDGFTNRFMQVLEQQKVPTKQVEGLLNKKQLIIIITAISAILIYIILSTILKQENIATPSSFALIFEKIRSIEFKGFEQVQISKMTDLIYLLGFVAMTFMSFELIFKKRLKKQVKPSI